MKTKAPSKRRGKWMRCASRNRKKAVAALAKTPQPKRRRQIRVGRVAEAYDAGDGGGGVVPRGSLFFLSVADEITSAAFFASAGR